MRKIFGLLLLLLFTFSACEEEEASVPLDGYYLAFGHFYGFCEGEKCVEIFKLQGDRLFEDLNDNYPSSQHPYDGNFVPRSDADYQKVKDLYASFPQQLLEEPSGVIGSPDATDGGGIYLEISVNGKKKFFLIDKLRQRVPEYLHPYLFKVENAVAQISN
ncbi:hypothetical protein [Sabulibacter ruber]|uniref:hypothetical protein n=1 Tax=Sabulibacter ruber TaxID=2811901 RepID=UPI001A9573D3|nr:hypothetical protein [Sabulibacter ruber]